jgi:uncharacterized membrane protein YkvA (DUF1232 family)
VSEDQYQTDFYQQMREGIRDWLKGKGKGYKYADYLLAAPDLFHLLCRVVIDPDVPAEEKAKLVAAIVYFVSPLDFFPEAFVGHLGYIDDIVVAAVVLNRLVNEINPDIVKRHWAGDEDVLALIGEILKVADQLVGVGLWERIKTRFGSQR